MRIAAIISLLAAVLMTALFFSGMATAQEADESVAQQESATAADDEIDAAASVAAGDETEDAGNEDEEGEALDDLDNPDFADLDEQTYEEDDDDFVPTEEVPADEAIPFPSDI